MRSKDQILLEKIYTEGLYSDDIDDETEEDEMEPLYIKGEYWFDESGEPMYADGDYGDMNHEMYVQDRCAGEVLSWFDIERYGDEMPLNLDNHIDEVVQFIFQKLNITDERKKEEIENDPYEAIINYLKNHTTMKGPIQEIVFNAGDSLSVDSREFAVKEWGWSRVHQNHIEVKELTREQLKIVASGINRALDQEGVYGDEDWLRASQSEYNISTYTGKRYKIKLEDMEKGNVQGLERADIEQSTSAATQQVRQMDVSQTPSFYKGHLGDSFVLNKDQMILESLYSEMAYPVSFSFEEFNNIKSYRGKMKYAQEKLQRLSSGSSRIVYKVDDEKVLKLAKNDKGIAQNATESDWSLQNYDIVAKVFEIGEENYWLEMELAKKVSPKRFQEIVGIPLNEIQNVLGVLNSVNKPMALSDRQKSRQREEEALEKVNNNEFFTDLWDMIGNYDMIYPADFGKISSYGEVLRNGKPTIVLVDFGLTRSTWDDFYKVN